jgi:hypothetical protein
MTDWPSMRRREREIPMDAKATEARRTKQQEKYEAPELARMGKIVDMTAGNTGSSTDSNAQTIPVQR